MENLSILALLTTLTALGEFLSPASSGKALNPTFLVSFAYKSSYWAPWIRLTPSYAENLCLELLLGRGKASMSHLLKNQQQRSCSGVQEMALARPTVEGYSMGEVLCCHLCVLRVIS